MNQQTTRLSIAACLAMVSVLGYLCMSRSFAHIGVSPLYLGEVLLAALLVLGWLPLLTLAYNTLLRPRPLTGLAIWVFVFLGYGLLQFLMGVGRGHSPFLAAQNVVFHIYILFLPIGIWLGRRHPQLLTRTVTALAWTNGIYGILYIAALSPLGLTASVESESVGLFGQPYGAAVAMLGLLCVERDLNRAWIPLLLNLLVFFGVPWRAVWLAFTCAFLLWGYLTLNLRRVALFGIAFSLLVLLALIVDVRFESPGIRGGYVSVSEVTGRVIAPVSPELARQFTPEAVVYSETAWWRVIWWQRIWEHTHSNVSTMMLGAGYGFPLWELHPWGVGDQTIRTPHNIFIYALAYTGWIGLAIFVGLQLTLARQLYRVFRSTGQAFGLCVWVLFLVWASFDGLLEAPYDAIPCYLLLGMCLAQSPEFQSDSSRRPLETNPPLADATPNSRGGNG